MPPDMRIGIPGSPHQGLQLNHGSLGLPITPIAPSVPQAKTPTAAVAMPVRGYAVMPPTQGSAIMTPNAYVAQPVPQPQTPTVLIDQSQPPSVPTSPIAPYVESPYPATPSPSPLYPTVPAQAGFMPMAESFWQRYKRHILIGGGVAGGLGLIALIAAAASRRREA